MKNASFKKILSTVLCLSLLLTVIFVISSCKEEHVHAFAGDVVVEATCETAGSVTKTCDCGETQVTEIPAPGHDLVQHSAHEATCTEDGNYTYITCRNCDYTTYTENTVIAKKGHTPAEAVKENEVPASCTADGSYDSVEYCADCREELNRDVALPIMTPGHALKTYEAVAATCLPGNYEYEECKVCDYSTYEEKIIPPAYEHILSVYPVVIEDSVVAPTCLEDGSYDMAICCTGCNYVFEDTRTSYVDLALGHDIAEHEAQAETCTEIGWGAYEDCTRCDYTTYVEIPELGHTEKDAINENVVASTCSTEGSYDSVIYCETCGDELSRVPNTVEKLPHAEENKTHHEAQAVTCTEIGWEAYWVCGDCGYSTYEEIGPEGHVEGDFVVDESTLIKPTCTESGSYNRITFCGVCFEVMKVEKWTVDPVEHNIAYSGAKAPTCTEIGWDAYEYCTKCGVYSTYEEIPALGHDEVNHAAKAPTCTEIGWDAYVTCKACGYTTYNELDDLGHSVVVLPAVAPTCTEDGLTRGEYCSVCGTTWSTQTVDPALGHDFGADGYCQNSGCSERISVGLSFELNSDGGYTFTGLGSCSDTEVIIPSEINGVPVTAISDEAFYNNSNIKSVVIPDSVKSIGEEAFFYCDSLESVVIGNGVEEIGAFAFFYCDSLTTVTIGGSVKSIGNGAFNYCPISVVYYQGTAAQWNSISIAGNNSALTGATRKYI